MKREILFRGKHHETGEWKFGSLLNDQNIGTVGVDLSHWNYCTVNPDTIGQYTGLTDKNGVKIFEGDIITTLNGSRSHIQFGEFKESLSFDRMEDHIVFGIGFSFDGIEPFGVCNGINKYEVIGNIHDNPELLA